jgi:hypothetical protein
MLRAGLDPASARALREVEGKLANFVDTPELRRADAEARAAEEQGKKPVLIDGANPRERLIALMDERGRLYAESGTHPNWWFASFIELLAWARPPGDAEDETLSRVAAETDPATGFNDAPPLAREGREAATIPLTEGEVA